MQVIKKLCNQKLSFSFTEDPVTVLSKKCWKIQKFWIEALKMELFVWQIVRVSPPFTGNRVMLQTSGGAMRQIWDDYGGMPGARCERCWDFWISGNISFPQSLPTLLMVTWVKNYFFSFLLWHHLVKCSGSKSSENMSEIFYKSSSVNTRWVYWSSRLSDQYFFKRDIELYVIGIPWYCMYSDRTGVLINL